MSPECPQAAPMLGSGLTMRGPPWHRDDGEFGGRGWRFPRRGPLSPCPPCRAGPGGTAGTATAAAPDTEVILPGSAHPRGNAAEAEEEEAEEEEEDTEEDEVQVIEIKKENSEAPRLQQRDKQASPPASPGCNSPPEKAGQQPSLGKKNDISRHSYSRYNTISYRRIRKGNTKQRIDEFESMMHL